MLCISQQITDPYFNIASEEYLLKNFTDDIFMLYRNDPSVIVGKHQNTFAEINYWFVKEHGIKVVRRLSGGGTVFHDEGNLNFCFIQNGQEGNLIDFKRFTKPVLELLHQMGIPAEQSGRNDLVVHGLKFSGNAEHVYKNRVLHHGTLLFSSHLNQLGEALRVTPDVFTDKAVKSMRSKVTNIADYLDPLPSIKEFEEKIMNHVVTGTQNTINYAFSAKDVAAIFQLMDEKYRRWEWNFGYSPRFIFKKQEHVNGRWVEILFEIEKGIIKEAQIKVDGKIIGELSAKLTGLIYREDIIEESLLVPDGMNSDAFMRNLF